MSTGMNSNVTAPVLGPTIFSSPVLLPSTIVAPIERAMGMLGVQNVPTLVTYEDILFGSYGEAQKPLDTLLHFPRAPENSGYILSTQRLPLVDNKGVQLVLRQEGHTQVPQRVGELSAFSKNARTCQALARNVMNMAEDAADEAALRVLAGAMSVEASARNASDLHFKSGIYYLCLARDYPKSGQNALDLNSALTHFERVAELTIGGTSPLKYFTGAVASEIAAEVGFLLASPAHLREDADARAQSALERAARAWIEYRNIGSNPPALQKYMNNRGLWLSWRRKNILPARIVDFLRKSVLRHNEKDGGWAEYVADFMRLGWMYLHRHPFETGDWEMVSEMILFAHARFKRDALPEMVPDNIDELETLGLAAERFFEGDTMYTIVPD